MPCRKLVVPSSGSTIQRCVRVGAFDLAALLHQEAIAGPGALDSSSNRISSARWSAAVTKFAGPLTRDLQLLDLAEIAREAAAGLAGGGDHDVHQR